MSSLGRTLDAELDTAEPGTVDVEREGSSAEIDVVDVDRLGVKVRRVKVSRGSARPAHEIAGELPDRLRSLPERVTPVEVSPKLGGATLRSRPEDMREREFFEVDVRGDHDSEVRRYRATDGGREEIDWTMTREQLGRLVDELDDDD